MKKLGLAVLLLGAAWAQIGGTGTIQGIVRDPSGALIPNASVTVKNAGTDSSFARQTNNNGLFVASPLPPGEYTVMVTASGFSRRRSST